MRSVELVRGLPCGALLVALVLAAPPAAAQGEAAGGDAPAPAEATETAREGEQELAQLRTRLEEWRVRAREYSEAREAAPALLEAFEREIAARQGGPAIALDEAAALEILQEELADTEQELSRERREAIEIEAEVARRAERRKRIPELVAAARQRLDQLPPLPAGASEAAGELAQLRRAVIEAELEAYQSELGSYEARGTLLAKRRDRATLRIVYYEALADALRDAVKARRQLAAESVAEAARESLEETLSSSPRVQGLVRELAQQNAQLAERRTGDDGLLEELDDLARNLRTAEEEVARVQSDLTRLQEKVRAAGLSGAVGLLLRRQLGEAPDAGKHRRFIRMREAQIAEVQLEQIELRERRAELTNVESVASRALDDLEEPLPPDERAELQEQLVALLTTQRDTLDALIADYETYFQRLVDYSALQQTLVARTDELVDFIVERVLWVPSGELVGPGLVPDAARALGWLFAPRYADQLGTVLSEILHSEPLPTLVALLLVAALFALRGPARRRVRELSEEAARPTCSRFAPTAAAFGLSLLMAAWPPALLAYAGWRLGVSPEAAQYTRCIADGLLAAAFFWLTVRVPREVALGSGVGELHFGWPPEATRALRRALSWLTAVGLPTVFAMRTFEMRGEDAWRESLGRLALFALLGAVAVFNHRLLREDGPLWSILGTNALRRPRRSAQRAVHGLSVALPLALVGLAAAGYTWTGFVLANRLHESLAFLFLVLLAFELAARFVRVAAREVQPTSPLMSGTSTTVALAGLLLIWTDVLPATGLLRGVQLWSVTRTVTSEVGDAAGGVQLVTATQQVPITLADLAMSLLIAVAALVLVRNLPGILEVSLFRRLGSGERYAFATIVRYGVIIGAVVLAFDALGLSWSSIQWLVAAVGLGLGFGLQEIFANFVSGLILLFERPVRVGDTVTVGDVSGTVSRIRIRATWITGFDRKELVVPNREFVTGRLVNWTLTDSILRIDIPIGIAYGSDTEKAIEVLHRCATENPLVLREPHPQVLFLGFGDSSLSFELRVFSPDVSHFLAIRHQLHLAIDRAFREAGVEIAFPQRDLHLRSVPAEWRPARAEET